MTRDYNAAKQAYEAAKAPQATEVPVAAPP